MLRHLPTITALIRIWSAPHVRQHRLRTALTVAGLALGVAMIVAIGAVNSSAIRSFRSALETIAGPAQLEVRGGDTGIPEELVESVRAVPGVDEAAPLLLAHLPVAGMPGEQLALFGGDVLAEQRIFEAQFPRERLAIDDTLEFVAAHRSIAVSETFAKRLGLAVGDPLRLVTPAGPEEVTVRGLLRPGGSAALFGGDVALMDLPAAQKLLGRDGRVDVIHVLAAPGETEIVEQRIAATVAGRASVTAASSRGSAVEHLLNSVRVSLTMASVLALIVGLLLIYQTTAVSVRQRADDLAVLGMLGFGRSTLGTALLLEALAAGVAGAVVGLPLGVGLAWLAISVLGSSFRPLLGIEISGFAVQATELIVGAASGLLLPVLAAAGPVLRATGEPPLRGLRRAYGTEDAIAPGRLLLVGAALGGAGVLLLWAPIRPRGIGGQLAVITPGLLAVFAGSAVCAPALAYWIGRTLRRRRSDRAGLVSCIVAQTFERQARTVGTTVAATSAGIVGVLALAASLQSVHHSFYDFTRDLIPADLVVSRGLLLPTTQPLANEVGARIGATDGVEAVAGYRIALVDYGGRPIALVAFDADVAARHGARLTAVDGGGEEPLRQLAGSDGVLAGEAFCIRYGCRTGDVLTLDTPSGRRTFPILATVVDYSSDVGSLWIDRALYQRVWGDATATSFQVWARGTEDVSALRQRLQATLADLALPIQNAAELLRTLRTQVDQTMSLAYASQLIAAIVVALAVVNCFLTAGLERRRETALLGAVGVASGHIRRVFYTEAALMGLVGAIYGALLAFVVSYSLVTATLRIINGWRLSYAYPWEATALVVPLAVGFSVVAAVWPVRRVSTTHLTDALAAL